MAVKKYIKFDSEKGYLDNKDDINYFATNQMRKVAFGKMLGDFDENGLYVINQKIIEELIKMPKVIVEIVDEADLIRSKVRADSFFHFILTVEDNKASFKLLEKLHYQSNRDFNSGVYSNINEYVLDEVKILDKDFDRNALYQKYNISTENDNDVLSIFDMDELSIALYYNIIEKLKINYLVQNQLILNEKQLEAIEADYFEDVLALLEEFKEFGDKVTAEVKGDLTEKHNFVIAAKPFFQQTVNEVLDSHIDFNINELTSEKKEQFLTKLRDVKANYYQQFKTVLPIEIARKSGVRFDANQIVQQDVLGDLSKEINSKGYTKSDVRKIKIDESELQLSIAKVKEFVNENEEMCKRDNARARDLTKGRERAAKFYETIKVNDRTLIENAITENAAIKVEEKVTTKVEEKLTSKSQEESKVDKKATADKKSQKADKKGKANTKKGNSEKPKKTQQQRQAPKETRTETTTTERTKIEYYSVSTKTEEKKGDKPVKEEIQVKDNVLDDILGTEIYADNYRNFDKNSKNEEIIRKEINVDDRRTENSKDEEIISIR